MISVGNRMPDWVKQGYEEYARRLPKESELLLKEIAPGKRLKKADVGRLVKQEGEKMIKAIPSGSFVVSLDLAGKPWTTEELSVALKKWQQGGQNISLLIGGPEGLSDSVKRKAQASWCLSNLTFPHLLVRIIVAEQLYRAWSMLGNHPYHK